MIIEEDNTKKFITSVSPKKYQEYVIKLMDRISLRMGQWLRGQLILSFTVGFLVYIGLSILGIKYAFVLALIAAITEIIPYVGPFLGAFPGVLIGFTISPLTGVFTILLYFIIQQMENSFLTPKIMSKAVGLNPVIVIISILVGAKIGGPIGAIISIPVAIILSIFLKDFMDYPWQYKGTQEPN
jgi:predicted PurR-regulated permease PerM